MKTFANATEACTAVDHALTRAGERSCPIQHSRRGRVRWLPGASGFKVDLANEVPASRVYVELKRGFYRVRVGVAGHSLITLNRYASILRTDGFAVFVDGSVFRKTPRYVWVDPPFNLYGQPVVPTDDKAVDAPQPGPTAYVADASAVGSCCYCDRPDAPRVIVLRTERSSGSITSRFCESCARQAVGELAAEIRKLKP